MLPRVLEILRRTQLCRYLDETEAQVVLDQGSLVGLPRGELLFETGDPGDSMFTILQGSIKVYQMLEDGICHTLTSLKVGDIIGEFAVVDHQPRGAHAMALEDSALFELSRDHILALMRSNPPIANKLLWTMLETITVKARANLEGYEAMVVHSISNARALPKAAL